MGLKGLGGREGGARQCVGSQEEYYTLDTHIRYKARHFIIKDIMIIQILNMIIAITYHLTCILTPLLPDDVS